MGRFHRHDNGTEHSHTHGEDEHDHGDHSAYETGPERISVLERIFTENDAAADANRALFDRHGVRAVNLMSSPGAGKTTLLEHTLRHLRAQGVRAGVVEGDIETSIDADRLSGLGAQVSLLNTGDGFGGECHLDAPMVAHALAALDLAALDVLLVENVGNLVCPAEFDVGAHDSAMVYAITEGEEKPLKYPVMFRAGSSCWSTRWTCCPTSTSTSHCSAQPATVNPQARVIEVSARTGAGLADWHGWLTARPVAAT